MSMRFSKPRKKNFGRKFAEQQVKKDFIKKEERSSKKGKIKLKSTVDKRNFRVLIYF